MQEKRLKKKLKHIMEVEFSLTFKLAVIFKYNKIEELLTSTY
jgi:hypothetical protein